MAPFTSARTKKVQDLLSRLSRTIGDKDYKKGRELLGELAERVGENDPEVTRARTLLEFVEDTSHHCFEVDSWLT